MAGYIGKSQGVTQVDGYTASEADSEFVNDPNAALNISSSASADSATIDASGNLLVGTTDSTPYNNSAGTSADTGIALRSDGLLSTARYNGILASFNRTGTDGDIIRVLKDGTTVGSIGSRNGTSMTLSSSGSVNMYDTSTSAGGIAVSSSVVYPINNTGATTDNLMDLGSSSVRFKDLYLSGGVVFGDAGGSGTPTSNTLDSYEEGTFDPTVGGVDSGNGFYRKIGDLIFIEIVLTANSISTDTIGGLPFNISSASGYGGLLFGRMTNCDVLDSNGVPCRMNFSFATIEFRQNSLNASDGSFTITSPASGTVRIGISGVGRVT
jgi:hypothetical protein